MTASRVQAAEGFTLIETLVASAVTITIAGAVFAVINPAHGLLQAQPEVADMQQRLRVAVDSLRHDLLLAGAGAYAGRQPGSLGHYFAPVLPYRAGLVGNDGDAGVFYRPDAITVAYVPPEPAQAGIAAPLPRAATDITVAPTTNCPPASAQTVCGLADGMRVALFDRYGARDVMTVIGVAAGTLQVRHAGNLSASYDTTATITRIVTDTYHLKSDPAANSFQLMHYDGYRTDAPVVDDVVGLRFEYFGEPLPPMLLPGKPLSDVSGPWTTYGPRPPEMFVDNPNDVWPAGENCVFAVAGGAHAARLPTLSAGVAEVVLRAAMLTDGPWCPDSTTTGRYDADLLRIRRVRVVVRVQAAAALLRGPAGRLFTRGGTASAAERYVPDHEIRFDVAPRNMSGGR